MEICKKKLSVTCSDKHLGIKTDNKLNFKEHVEELCTKASQKSVRWQKFHIYWDLNNESDSLIRL